MRAYGYPPHVQDVPGTTIMWIGTGSLLQGRASRKATTDLRIPRYFHEHLEGGEEEWSPSSCCFELPDRNAYWDSIALHECLCEFGMDSVVIHGCAYGLVVKHGDNAGRPK